MCKQLLLPKSIYLYFFLSLSRSQATVACSTLAGLNTHTIVSESLEKPQGIAVHPSEK